MVINTAEITAVLATAALAIVFRPALRAKSRLLRAGLLQLQLGLWALIVGFAVAYTASTPARTGLRPYRDLSSVRWWFIGGGLVALGVGAVVASLGWLMYTVAVNRRMTERLHHADREEARLDFPSGVDLATAPVRHD